MTRTLLQLTCAAALLLLALPVRAAGPTAARLKMAVLDIKAERGLERSLVRLLDEVLLATFQRTGRYETFGSSDIAAMLDLEELKQKTTGCVDDSCLVEIGGALGVDLLASASAGQVGSQWVVTLKLLDVKRARVLARAIEEVPAEEDALLAAVRRTVDTVVAAHERAQAPAGAATDSGAIGGTRIAAWILAGLAGAALIGGGVSGGLALAAEQDLEDVPQVDANERQDLTDRADSSALAADVLLGVGGAAAVAALVLFLWPEDDAAGVAVTPARHGVVASARWRW